MRSWPSPSLVLFLCDRDADGVREAAREAFHIRSGQSRVRMHDAVGRWRRFTVEHFL